LEQKFEITDLKSGNVKVYEALFKQLYKPLCQYANSILHDADEAEDMTQKTFCKLWDQREKLEIHSSIISYLYRMVHNESLNRLKQWQTQAEHHEQMAYNSVSAINNVEYAIAHKELKNRIDTAIAELPERCRQVFLLSRMQHFSYAEIAQEMKISPNTVETQMVKALKMLRLNLKEYLVLAIIFFPNIY
jgi:RNA polymerase sigma-70 factor (ECF subfamily)